MDNRDDELEREIRSHLELEAEERQVRGMSAADARYAARRAFGNVTRTREDVRAVWTRRWLEELVQDARYAVRALRNNPAFSAVAILTLALGIAAATSIFSIVRGVLLQPLPFKDADRLVQIIENVPAAESLSGRAMRIASMNQSEFDWWRTEARTLSHMAAIMPESSTVLTPEGTERLAGARVSPALFAMRGVSPVLGRWLRADEERPDASVVVLSEATWRRHFGGVPSVINRTITLDGQPHTVVGVMPEAFGGEAFWMPFAAGPQRPGAVTFIAVTSRLADGVSLDAAAAEANVLGQRLRGVPPETGAPPRFDVVREQDRIVAAVRPALRMLVAAVAVVLLIVCANVANLLLGRGTSRGQELCVRGALGATRLRVVRQLLTESVVLSLVGGVAGVALAYASVSFVRAWGVIEIPARFRFGLGPLSTTILPRVDEIAVDPAALAFAVGVSLATAVAFGMMPALHLSRADGEVASSGLNIRAGISSAHTRAGQVLAGVQMALATALLVGAGLLVYSFVNLSSLPLGFDRDTQIFQLVSPGEYRPSRKVALASEVLERLNSLPGVTAAGFTNMAPPLDPDDDESTIVPAGWPLVDRRNPGEENRSEQRDITPDYLRALGVRLVEGRWFDARDTAGQPRVMLVNQAWVRRFSPDRSPVGTMASSYTIVGVVEDMRLRMDSGRMPGGPPIVEMEKAVFMPLLQEMPPAEVLDRPGRMDMGGSGTTGGSYGWSFVLRARPGPLTAADLRRVIRDVDPGLAVEDLTTMGRVFSALTARPRFYASVMALFGAIAAVIAAIGVYGVLAYSASRRTREFGIRLALGATPRQVLRLALRQGVIITAVGISAGVIAALGLTQYLGSMLFGLTPLDAETYLIVAIGFAAVSMFASYVPARRATRISPIAALRYE